MLSSSFDFCISYQQLQDGASVFGAKVFFFEAAILLRLGSARELSLEDLGHAVVFGLLPSHIITPSDSNLYTVLKDFFQAWWIEERRHSTKCLKPWWESMIRWFRWFRCQDFLLVLDGIETPLVKESISEEPLPPLPAPKDSREAHIFYHFPIIFWTFFVPSHTSFSKAQPGRW